MAGAWAIQNCILTLRCLRCWRGGVQVSSKAGATSDIRSAETPMAIFCGLFWRRSRSRWIALVIAAADCRTSERLTTMHAWDRARADAGSPTRTCGLEASIMLVWLWEDLGGTRLGPI